MRCLCDGFAQALVWVMNLVALCLSAGRPLPVCLAAGRSLPRCWTLPTALLDALYSAAERRRLREE
jgi:hypothetical protein